MPRGRHVGICNVVGLSGLVGAPQVTRSAATPVGNAVSSEIREKLPDFTGLARGARDSVTKLREIQANFSTTKARLRRAKARLCGAELRLCGAKAWLCGAKAWLCGAKAWLWGAEAELCGLKIGWTRPRFGCEPQSEVERS